MKIEEGLKLTGRWRMVAHYKGTKKVFKVLEGDNLIVSVGKYLVGDMLIDRAGYDTGLTVHAIGSDATAPAVTDTSLAPTEVARKTVTAKTRLLNVITYSTFFTAGESTFAIEEAGIFGHSTADPLTPDSGILFNHYLVSFDNTGGLFDLTFYVVLTLG